MELNLPPDLETLINKRLSSGAYTHAEEVLRDALEAQDAEESWTEEELEKFLNISMSDFVEDAAKDTGGDVVFTGAMPPKIRATPHPNAELRLVIQRMRRHYRMYYDRPPGKAGQHRRIDIELSPSARAAHPGARIIARKGYVIPESGSQ